MTGQIGVNDPSGQGGAPILQLIRLRVFLTSSLSVAKKQELASMMTFMRAKLPSLRSRLRDSEVLLQVDLQPLLILRPHGRFRAPSAAGIVLPHPGQQDGEETL